MQNIAGPSSLIFQTTLNDSCQYSFSSVVAGTYRLEAHKAGFATVVVPAVIVSTNHMTENVDQGLMGTEPVVNQAFMITEMPTDEIAYTQVKNLRDAIKYSRSSPTAGSRARDPSPLTRGLQGTIA